MNKRAMPKWMRIASAVVGVLLLGDGMRRFVAPTGERDLYAFLMYVIVGMGCLVSAFFRFKDKK